MLLDDVQEGDAPTTTFVGTRSRAAEKYSRQQAADLPRRFRRVKLALKLEEVSDAEARRASAPPKSAKAVQLICSIEAAANEVRMTIGDATWNAALAADHGEI